MVSCRKASKSADGMQVWLFAGCSWKCELRLSVSYMPGTKVGFGSSSGAELCAEEADASDRTRPAARLNTSAFCCFGFGLGKDGTGIPIGRLSPVNGSCANEKSFFPQQC